jgi:hypothetical protein
MSTDFVGVDVSNTEVCLVTDTERRCRVLNSISHAGVPGSNTGPETTYSD